MSSTFLLSRLARAGPSSASASMRRFLQTSPAAKVASAVKTGVPASLHLKSGQSFHGTSFGSQKSIWGETVFSTSITSC